MFASWPYFVFQRDGVIGEVRKATVFSGGSIEIDFSIVVVPLHCGSGLVLNKARVLIRGGCY